jgi:hypothetical protein
MSQEMTITQWHVPVDDTHCYWYAIFTSYSTPVDKKKMREQRLELYELPDYVSRKNKTNDYGFDPHEQATETYTGMGLDINVHDQWAVESMGAIRIAPASISASPTRRSFSIAACCVRKSKRLPAAPSRYCSWMRRTHAPFRGLPRWTALDRHAAGKSTGWKSM